MNLLHAELAMPAYNRRLVTVTQTVADLERHQANIRKESIFVEWCEKLHPKDRLPRGRHFAGKKPGPKRKLLVMDECWRLFATPNFGLCPLETSK